MSEQNMRDLRHMQGKLAHYQQRCIQLETSINNEVDLAKIIEMNDQLANAEADYNATLREIADLEDAIRRNQLSNRTNTMRYSMLSQPQPPQQSADSYSHSYMSSPSPAPVQRDATGFLLPNPSTYSDDSSSFNSSIQPVESFYAAPLPGPSPVGRGYTYQQSPPPVVEPVYNTSSYQEVSAPLRAATYVNFAPTSPMYQDVPPIRQDYQPVSTFPTGDLPAPIPVPVVATESAQADSNENPRPLGWDGAWPLITTRQMQDFAKWKSKKATAAVGA
ncbi:UNVERIFIED_CONTAM: hypothetical protein HDU68_008280 [Siphonaria sp. JEL0065]|nr:hypothetical protein HDU68_008280 [Siphonaria sp. JEL0065]